MFPHSDPAVHESRAGRNSRIPADTLPRFSPTVNREAVLAQKRPLEACGRETKEFPPGVLFVIAFSSLTSALEIVNSPDYYLWRIALLVHPLVASQWDNSESIYGKHIILGAVVSLMTASFQTRLREGTSARSSEGAELGSAQGKADSLRRRAELPYSQSPLEGLTASSMSPEESGSEKQSSSSCSEASKVSLCDTFRLR
jgi:hypothetical protein